MNSIGTKMLCMLCMALLAACLTAYADDYTIGRHTVDGGGAMFGSGASYEVSGTAAQPDAGILAAGGYTLTGGAWFGQVRGDCNNDSGINLFDAESIENCLLGPEAGLTPGCQCLDFDDDGDVDVQDFIGFQASFSG